MAALIAVFPGTAIASGNIVQHRFTLSETTLIVSYPDNESREYPGFPVVLQVDIGDNEKYDNWFEAITTFDKYWDY